METEVTSTSDQNGEQDEELSMDKDQSLASPIFVISEVCSLNTKEQSMVNEQSLQLPETNICQTSDTCSATEDQFCEDIVFEEEPCTEMHQSSDMHTFVISDTIDQMIPSDDGFIDDSAESSEYLLLNSETSYCRKTCDSCSETEDEFYDCRICGEGYSEMNDLMAHTLTHNEQSLGCNAFEENCKEKSGVLVSASTFTDSYGSENVFNEVIDLTDDGHINVHEEMLPRESANNESLVAPVRENCLPSDSAMPRQGYQVKGRNYSNIGRSKCTVCGKHFKSKKTLCMHMALHKNPGGFKCIHCGKVITRKSNLKLHLASQSGKGPFKCSVCGNVFAQRCAMKIHKALHNEKQPNKDTSGQETVGTEDLNHQLALHVRPPYECNVCGKTFEQESSLNLHIPEHNDLSEPGNSSHISEPSENNRTTVESEHVTYKESLTCIVCGKVFKTYWGVRRHMEVHKEGKPHRCSICGKQFKWHGNMLAHKKRHFQVKENSLPSPQQSSQYEERLYQCSVCGQSFREMESMNIHMAELHTHRRYRCEICDKTFKVKWQLRKHDFVVHSEDVPDEQKPFNCTECGKLFRFSHHMSLHMTVHTGETPYECEICGRGFVTNLQLQNHMVVHTDAKPFECVICRKGCKTKNGLASHIRSHTVKQTHT